MNTQLHAQYLGEYVSMLITQYLSYQSTTTGHTCFASKTLGKELDYGSEHSHHCDQYSLFNS
jgi:hypothetical protein